VNFVPRERINEFVRNGWHSDSSLQPQRSFPQSTTNTTTITTTRVPFIEPSAFTSSSTSDYHFRTVAPIKKYKFTQKLIQRPRLRIRRPGETQHIHGNRTASLTRPLAIPLLTPFRSNGDQSIIRNGFGTHSRGFTTNFHDGFQQTLEEPKHFGGEQNTFDGGTDTIVGGRHGTFDGRTIKGSGRQTSDSEESTQENHARSRFDARTEKVGQESEAFGDGSGPKFGTGRGGFGGGSGRFEGGSGRKQKWDYHDSTKGGSEINEGHGKLGGKSDEFGRRIGAEFGTGNEELERESGRYDGSGRGFGGGREQTWSSHESAKGTYKGSMVDEDNGKSGSESNEFGREHGAEFEFGSGIGGGNFGGGKGGFGGGRGILNTGGDGFSGTNEGSGEGNDRFDGGNGGFGGGFDGFGRGSGHFGRGSGGPPVDFGSASFGLSGTGIDVSTEFPPGSSKKRPKSRESEEEGKSQLTSKASVTKASSEEFVIPQNSGLLAVAPPPEFQGGFGSSRGRSPFETAGAPFGGSSGVTGFGSPSHKGILDPPGSDETDGSNHRRPKVTTVEESIFTGETAFTPNRKGPTGDGFGPPLFPGVAIPPPVPAIGLGGDAAGLRPYNIDDGFQNPPTTVKPSALLSMLNKADLGFNQAINHFEQGTPLESAAIDILEVALGSQKLDSQAKLLGHVDRTIGIDNLQRLQRWANTGGALDAIKEQFAKIAKNYSPPENLLPTLPPQLSYLFTSTGKR
ncbi:hypothetical protein Tcan_05334, partial [Toxocara canis]